MLHIEWKFGLRGAHDKKQTEQRKLQQKLDGFKCQERGATRNSENSAYENWKAPLSNREEI